MTINDIYKRLVIFLGLRDEDVVKALTAAGVELPMSRVNSWRQGESSDNYREMSVEDLGDFVDGLLMVRERTKSSG